MMRVGVRHLICDPNQAFNADFMWSQSQDWGLWFISGWGGPQYAVCDDFGNLVRVEYRSPEDGS